MPNVNKHKLQLNICIINIPMTITWITARLPGKWKTPDKSS